MLVGNRVSNNNLRAAELRKLWSTDFGFEYRVNDEEVHFVRQLPIKDGVRKKIKTATAADFSIVLSKSEFKEIKRELSVYTNLEAPIKKGEVVGEIIYKIEDREIGRVEIVADEDIGKVGWFKRLIRKILSWLGLD